jgi:hypothetical protein
VVAARKGLDSKVLEKFKAALRAVSDPAKGTSTKDGKSQSILGQWGVSGLTETKDAEVARGWTSAAAGTAPMRSVPVVDRRRPTRSSLPPGRLGGPG